MIANSNNKYIKTSQITMGYGGSGPNFLKKCLNKLDPKGDYSFLETMPHVEIDKKQIYVVIADKN